MSKFQQIFFIVISIITIMFIIQNIRKHRLNIADSIIWILWALFLIFISLIPKFSYYISQKMGFQATSNFLFTLFIFLAYIIVFYQSIQISELKEKNKELVQKISIYMYENDSEKKK